MSTIELPAHLRETLSMLGRRNSTAAELKIEGISINAVSNRLADLVRMGVVRRKRVGRSFVYSKSK